MSKRLIFGLVALLFLFTQCEKDDPDPPYVGTWEEVVTVVEDGESFTSKDQFIFTKDAWEYTSSGLFIGQWIDFLKARGSMVVTGQDATFTVSEIGVVDLNSGTIRMVGASDPEFDEILTSEGVDMPSTFEGTLVVSGNQLTFSSGQTWVLTKQ